MPIPSFPPRAEDTLKSDSAGIPGAAEVRNVVTIPQAGYDALAVKDAKTLYIVTPDPAP
jgi:hypothetical protein